MRYSAGCFECGLMAGVAFRGGWGVGEVSGVSAVVGRTDNTANFRCWVTRCYEARLTLSADRLFRFLRSHSVGKRYC